MNLSLAHNSEDQVKENLGEISQRQNSLVQRMTTFHPWTGYIWSPCLKKDQPKKSTHRNTIDWERQPTRNHIFCLNYYANYLQIFFKCYLLPKSKLTVSTQKTILNTRNYWELRIEEEGSGIKDWESRIEDCGLRDCQLTFECTIYLSNFKALPSCYRKNLYLITWFQYSQRKYTLLYPLLLQFSERQQSSPTWKTCFHMTNICVSYRECLEKNNSGKCNNLTSKHVKIIFEIKWNWHTFDTSKRAICHIIRCSFQNMFIHHLKCVVISMFYSSWNN